MDTTRKPSAFFLGSSILLCGLYFILFIFPNRVASENIQMVAVFEPDESVPMPYVFDMIAPADTVKESLINFAFYEYYFYGFPYFAVSALSILPLRWFGVLGEMPWVMTVLRQVISVLPMLLSILLLVYMQTRFRSYRSIVLLLLLLSLPAVVRNGFWWHPDSLAIFFAMLVIFFLQRDDLRFGPNFYIAAIMCGFSAGTKGIGFYFFLSIFVYLLFGYFSRKVSVKKLVWAGVGFLACMVAAYVFANPILLYSSVRKDYFSVMIDQSGLLSEGYQTQYAKGLFASLPLLTQYYGNIFFVLISLFACIVGLMDKKTRLFNTIALTWLLPVSVLVFEITHFKFQYWLPVALPLFSTLIHFFPETPDVKTALRSISFRQGYRTWMPVLIPLVVVIQFASFVNSDIALYSERLDRANDNSSIQFYDLALKSLEPLDGQKLFVYHDVRMYVPPTPRWRTRAVFYTLDYDYVASKNFDVMLLMQQRIYDYLDPGAQGIDPEKFAQSQVFYRDADNGTVTGYRLVERNDFGLVFVREDLYQQYFQK